MVNNIQLQGSNYFRKNEAIYINRVEEASESDCQYHSHDFMELCYVLSGKGYHIVDHERYQTHKGDLFIINYEKVHTFYKENTADDLITYNIVFKPDFLDYSLINCSEFRTVMMSYLFKNLDNNEMVKEDLRLNPYEQEDFDFLIGKMHREYSMQQEGYISILRAYLIELIVKIMRCLHERKSNDYNNRKDYFVNAAIKYLNENYTKSMNLEELTLKCFLSKNYLCKIFKNTTGMTMSDYMQILRIDEACKLLKETDKKVVEIAYEVGYSDYKSFNNVFKKIKGMKPSAFKNL